MPILLCLLYRVAIAISAENIPRFTLPPLHSLRKRQERQLNPNILLMDQTYVAKQSNEALLHKLFNPSRLLVSNTPFADKLGFKGNLSDSMRWQYDSTPGLYNLPLEVRKENDLSKWKRVIALLKSMNFEKAPQEVVIVDPPEVDHASNLSQVVNDLTIEKELMANKI